MTPVVESKKTLCRLPNWPSNIPDSEIGLYIIEMCQKIDRKMYIIIIIWRVCYLTVIEKSRDLLNKNKNKNKIKMRGDVICQIQLGFVTFVIYLIY